MDVHNPGGDCMKEVSANTLAAGRFVKTKKSLPRLFSLSRKKSFKSKPPSIISTSSSSNVPSLPNGQALPEASSIVPQSFLTKDGETPLTAKGEVLRESSGNTRRSKEYSPRDKTATTPDVLPKGKHGCAPFDGNQTLDTIDLPKVRHPRNRMRSSRTWHETLSRKRSHRETGLATILSVTTRDRGVSSTHNLSREASDSTLPPRPVTAAQVESRDSSRDPFDLMSPTGNVSHLHDGGATIRKSNGSDEWNRWHGILGKDRPRNSSRSGLSSRSSHPDSGSVEQSSIYTKISSVSDMTVDFDEQGRSKHDSMTVDDAIELYSAGFNDDFGLKEGDPMRATNSEETRRRSTKIAEAMNEPMESPTLSPPPAISVASHSSAAIMSGEVFRSLFPKPPSIQVPTDTHDQYGFRKASREIDIDKYNSWVAEYAGVQNRRNNKWKTFMKDQGLATQNPTRFPERSAKTQRFIRKGIPPAWRGEAWFFYAGGESYLGRHPDLYAELVLRSQTPKLSTIDRESIEIDLNRSFPNNIHFKPDPPLTPSTETPLLSSLRRVLSAFAIHHPRIGYCQSLNFLAGLLLLFLPEEKAFWMLHIITTTYLPGTHEISLEGANVDLWVLMLALKEALPGIWAKVGAEVNTTTSRLPPISLCTTSWFMSLFIGTLPIESVLRVWDVLFYEGSRTLFRVAIAIFKLGEQEIKSVSDPMEIFQVVQQLPRKMVGVGGLLEAATKWGGVSQGWVERRRAERKEWYAKERAREKVRKVSRDVGRKDPRLVVGGDMEVVEEQKVEEERSPARSRAGTVTAWRTRLGLGKRTE